ncbi:MAG: 2TM domain-containing protein [Planctomycetaceae bacterium]
MATTDMRKVAEMRVDTRFGFYIHALVFAAVITLLWAINLSKSPDQLWAHWPTAGWGFGLICHGLTARIRQTVGTESVRDQLVDAELESMREPQ